MIQGPLLFCCQVVKDLVNREVAEVEIRGKPARAVIVRMVPVFLVDSKFLFNETLPSSRCLGGASALIHDADLMVHREPGQRVRISFKNF